MKWLDDTRVLCEECGCPIQHMPNNPSLEDALTAHYLMVHPGQEPRL